MPCPLLTKKNQEVNEIAEYNSSLMYKIISRKEIINQINELKNRKTPLKFIIDKIMKHEKANQKQIKFITGMDNFPNKSFYHEPLI